MKTVCGENKCAGCMACVDICPKQAIEVKDELSFYNAEINDKCIDCGLCHKVCPQNNTPEFLKPKVWYQGWAKDEDVRAKGASGGMATSIATSFVRNGGVIYSCCFENGQFRFHKANNEKDLIKFAGSKYVKSNPEGIYNEIKQDLKNNQSVLFIGLPCQVAALKKSVTDNTEKLYTSDLICHGTPSPKLLNVFLNQYDISLDSTKDIIFRANDKRQIWCENKGLATKGVSDKFTIAYINGYIHTENCYECNYSKLDRVSDITLGDSWGSELYQENSKQGVSLILCQTEKGEELLRGANVELREVNLDNAVSNNEQLNHPPALPGKRKSFLNAIKNGKSFNKQVRKVLPKQCIKQNIKAILIKAKLVKGDN